MIEVDSFTKIYGTKKADSKAVDGVSFVAQPGVITGLLGPNGAGKTTILKAICALHYPTQGAVRVMGRDVESFPVEVRSLVGYVSEQPALIGSLTAKDFLQYAGELRFAGRAGVQVAGAEGQAVSQESLSLAVDRVVEECQLQEVLHKPISHLSKGYRQRLSFAQALLHNPPVLVLDEPVSGLDPAQIRQMRDMIKRLGREKTILLSTHLMQEVEALCQQVHIISRGRLVASGSAQEIAAATSTKSFEDAFLKLTC
ncbi:MAG: ABC transporter ATP-binding protein [Treponema sp.]|nr:ABC transporter ATP-binding protein [Treponema sp.]